jgi:hypothetical protein
MKPPASRDRTQTRASPFQGFFEDVPFSMHQLSRLVTHLYNRLPALYLVELVSTKRELEPTGQPTGNSAVAAVVREIGRPRFVPSFAIRRGCGACGKFIQPCEPGVARMTRHSDYRLPLGRKLTPQKTCKYGCSSIPRFFILARRHSTPATSTSASSSESSDNSR